MALFAIMAVNHNHAEADVRVRTAITGNTTMTAAYGSQLLVGTISGNITLTLPSSPRAGQVVDIQDADGVLDATHAVAITPAAGTINGASSLSLATAYGGKRCIYTGAKWVAR